MLPIFVFISLPVLSVTLLLVILCRKLNDALHPSPARLLERSMSRLEALRLLGLCDGADKLAIRTAYKRLMIKYHPDHGGSHHRAAMLNLARDTLLIKRRRRAA